MPLTDTAIRNAKPAGKLAKLSDGGGLQLWLMPQGSKLWRLAYRFQAKQKLLSIGSYPEMSLKQAREKREEARALLAREIDPAEQKKADRHITTEKHAQTFKRVAAELTR